LSSDAVEVRNLARRFAGVAALDDVTLSVQAGTFAVLLGPSGSGKTTLLSIIGGFLEPSAGSVWINGEDMSDVPPARRPTATVFQDYALFPHMSVAGNVAFGLTMRGVDRGARTERVKRMLDLVGLGHVGARKPHELSGGQRQRVALARALAVEPTVLLLDEPLGALDLKLRRQMQAELKHIQREVGTTFIHVTHDQDEAMAIADLVVILNAARVEDYGPPQRVYTRPRTRFAATFMGESTLIEGIAGNIAGDVMRVSTRLGELGVKGSRAPGTKVTLALRPEGVRLGDPQPGEQPLGALRVTDLLYQGSFMRLTGTTPAGVTISVRAEAGDLPAEGETVSVVARPGGLVLLED
jgi:spermidine/putrescine transport system ATP-binding protein